MDGAKASWNPPVLTVIGILAAVLITAWLVLPGEGEVREWRLYLAVGTVFPALLVGLAFAAYRLGERQIGLVDAAFAALGATVGAVYVVQNWNPSGLFIAATCAWVARTFERPLAAEVGDAPGGRWQEILALFTLLLAAHVFIGVGWWRNPAIDQPQLSLSGVVLIVLLVMGVSALVVRDPVVALPGRRLALAVLPVVVVFGLAAMRLPVFEPNGAIYHWSVFVGPADLVREGGLLLWDVPATYGTLLTFAIAWFPAASAWEALRLVAALCILASALALLGFVVASRRGVGGVLLGAGLAFTTVYLLPNHTYDFVGPFPFPSTGAFRFGPAYVALAAVAFESVVAARPQASPRERLASLGLGSVAWVGAALWSFEAAIYATAVWFPAIAWSRFGQARRSRPERGMWYAVGRGMGAVLLALGGLGLVFGGVLLLYRFAHGVTPDPSGYSEYASAFARDGFFSMPIDPWAYGPAQLLLVLVVICVAMARAFSDPTALDRQVAGLAAFGAVWSTASYFVARSHTNNAMVLNPIEVTAFVVLWFVWTRANVRMPPVTRWVVVVWMVSLLFEGLYAPSRLRPVVAAMWSDPFDTARSRMPPTPPGLLLLFEQAKVGPDDRLVFVSRDLHPPFGFSGGRATDLAERPWLPIIPVAGVEPLGEERRLEYVDRFARRQPRAGWSLVPKAQVNAGDVEWLASLVDTRYRVTRSFEDADWRLEWRQPRRPRRDADKPRWVGGRLVWPAPRVEPEP